MRFKSYIVARDYGFAPNPFGRFCTLACCKQKIRQHLNVGDWVFGTGSKKYDMDGRLVFAMNITERITFQKYWDDDKFAYKKPIMNGSLVQMYGDNIYHKDESSNDWQQENSHHSLENGPVNGHNLERDLSGKYVLVSEHFYYFGKNAIMIPQEFIDEICISRQGHKNVEKFQALHFLEWLSSNYKEGRHEDPLLFSDSFERFDGVS